MNQENFNKLLEDGPEKSHIDYYDLVHSPEFEKVIEDEPWDEYKKEDFQ